MNEPKVILFYRFTPLADPEAIRLWQQNLCESLALSGRILISKDGINATLGGDIEALRTYVKRTRSHPAFKGIDVKWSDGNGQDFPRLRIRVRDELVTFGAPGELEVDEGGVVGTGAHLKPEALHRLVEERGEEVVFFDARNYFEAKIGRFKDAVVPKVRATRDFIDEIDSGKYDHLKDSAVVTYCTGGVRCEVLSALMVRRGFKEVYQLDGGILRYGERYADEGLWEGSVYLFDARMHHEFSVGATTLGRCERCHEPTSQFYNCANLECRKLILLCESCGDANVSTRCVPEHQLL